MLCELLMLEAMPADCAERSLAGRAQLLLLHFLSRARTDTNLTLTLYL